jgi:integrase
VVLDERRIEIKRAVWQGHPGQGRSASKHEKPTKSRKARRVATSSRLAEELASWYAESVETGGADPGGYVWPGKAGQAMDDCASHHLLRRAQARAERVDDLGKPLVTFHGLRHTAASIMLSRDVPLIVVSRQLGHANPHITATIYARLLSGSELDLAARAFED